MCISVPKILRLYFELYQVETETSLILRERQRNRPKAVTCVNRFLFFDLDRQKFAYGHFENSHLASKSLFWSTLYDLGRNQ